MWLYVFSCVILSTGSIFKILFHHKKKKDTQSYCPAIFNKQIYWNYTSNQQHTSDYAH
jgi:hypothetical protein